jgi:transcription elongation GreA/GreB family factor
VKLFSTFEPMKSEDLKQHILNELNGIVENRISAANTEIQSINESKTNETKSSAGDKYETGMAMLQIEEQKAAVQLAKAKEFKQVLSRIGPSEECDSVQLGSLVETNLGNFFVAAAIGKITIGERDIFVLSIGSPLGQSLKAQKIGAKVSFQGKEIEIISIR